MRPIYAISAFAAGLGAALAVAACGSSPASSVIPVTVTKTVAAPPPTTSTSTSTSTGPTATTPTTTTQATTPTRTQTAPQFTGGTPASGTASGPLAKAVSTVQAAGYTPLSTGTYDSANTLRVLIAARTGSADDHTQQAFFFEQGNYLGTDTASPSAAISVVSQSDTEITLGYAIYRAGDPLCCSTGGTQNVTFTLNNGVLSPQGPIPPVSARR